MRKSVGSFITLNRRSFLLLGVVICLVGFGVIAWQVGAQNGRDKAEGDTIRPDRVTAGDGNVSFPQREGTLTRYENGVIKIEPTGFGVTGPVRDLPAFDDELVTTKLERAEQRRQRQRDKGMTEDEIQTEEINRQNAKRIKKTLPGAGAGEGPFQDPLVNRGAESNAPQVMPTPGLTFDGATQADNVAVGGPQVLPPDTNGDVGPNHYVSSVNLVYKIFNKNGTVAAGPFATNTLFNGLPANDPCRTLNHGDPIVMYDPLADRWHISQFAIPANPNSFQCVALSVTGDPTGAYYVWSYLYPGTQINDYPKVGVWPDAYHMTFNQFNNAGTAFLGAGILSQDRPKALAGDPTASVVYLNLLPIDPNAGGLLPTDVDGIVPPPAGMAQVFGEYKADEFGDPLDAIRYYKWVPNFVTPASSVLTVLPDVALAAFDARQPTGRGDIEQSGGAALDSLSDRLMHRFAYRNLGTFAAPVNSFTGSFAVNVSGVAPTSAGLYQTGIRWFEMRRTGDTLTVFDQGTHNLAPGNGASGLNNWMGSIAQDNDGNLALGFSQSGTGQNADIKIAGRTVNTMNSGILNEGEALFFDATGSQTSTSNRWGDYSAMNVDPVDDCTFWYTQEYYAATGTGPWSTRVGRFIYPSCTAAPKGTISGTITFCSGGNPVNQAEVSATGGFHRLTIANGTYSMTVPPGTFTVSAKKGAGNTGATTPSVVVVNGGTSTANICLQGVPILTAGTATIVSESCLPANGVVDPGETVTVAFPVTNTGGANTVNDVGTLQATGGVTSPSGPQNYGVVVAGGPPVSRNFTFTASPALLCGANITASVQHQDSATNLGNLVYTIPTGSTAGGATTTSYTGPPVAVPDNVPAGVNIILPVSGITGGISDLNFRLDALAGCDAVIGNTNASMDHTFNGDLAFKLTSPAGTTVALITNRGAGGNNFCTVLLDDDGGFPATSTMSASGAVTGNFAPESPLSAFDGQDPNGNWTLNVADTVGIDTGSLRRFSLLITPRICCAGGPTPTATPTSTGTPAATATATATPTATPTPCPPLTFSNTTPIIVPATGTTAGISNPYPSNIAVAGLAGTVTNVTVRLNSFNHTFPDDVDVLLVGPGGQNAIIMSDVGTSLDVVNVTLTLDDTAATALPDAAQLVTGTFRPTNIGAGDLFAAPAPAPAGGSMLSVFNGTAPNGTWSLYVVDDLGGDIGNFNGGWDLSITTTNCGTPPPVISGTVTYGNALGNPTPPRFVSNVLISGAGSVPVSTLTDFPGGAYALTGFGSGAYTVTPSKTGGVNGAISSFDAALIALHVAGPPNPQLTSTQLIVADVSGNSSVTSFDAGMIAKFVAGPPYAPPGIGATATWRFTPVSRNYASVTGNVTGEDYTAFLMGEVSGNWMNTGARPGGGGDEPPRQSRWTTSGLPPLLNQGGEPFVELPTLVASVEKEIIVPVNVQGATNKGIISYEFDLRYDQSVIQPLPSPVDVAGTVSRGLFVVANQHEPGLLRVVVYGAIPLDGDGVLLNLRFTAVGAVGSISPLTWKRVMFNEGEPEMSAIDGLVELSKW